MGFPAHYRRGSKSATPAVTEDTLLPFDLPAVNRKKGTADFVGGSISPGEGLVLLRAPEHRLELAEALAGCIREWRDPTPAAHTLPAMLRFHMFAIACGADGDRAGGRLAGDRRPGRGRRGAGTGSFGSR